MDDKMKNLAVKLLKDWAAAKANPDTLVVFSGRSYSANDYVREVEQETPFGKEFLDHMESSAKSTGEPLDQFIKDSIGRMIAAEKRRGPSI